MASEKSCKRIDDYEQEKYIEGEEIEGVETVIL